MIAEPDFYIQERDLALSKQSAGSIGFFLMIAVAVVGGLILHDPVDEEMTLRALACAEAEVESKTAEGKPTDTYQAVLSACAQARDAEGVLTWGPEVRPFDPPIEYIELSGFIKRPKRIDAILGTGYLKGAVCAEHKYRWGASESRSTGGEWTPDVRRRRCHDAYAENLMRYEILDGPDADQFYLVATLMGGDFYIGWTHLHTLDLRETYLGDS